MTESLTDKILRLDKEATAGPWFVDDSLTYEPEPGLAIIAADRLGPLPSRGMTAWVGLSGANFKNPQLARAQADLIAEYRTLAPRLAERYVEMEKALELIKELGNSTLISPSMGYDYDQAYRDGAHNAFSNAADIASAVLAKSREG